MTEVVYGSFARRFRLKVDERIRKIYGRSNPTQHLMKELIRGLFRWLSRLRRTLGSNENAEKGR